MAYTIVRVSELVEGTSYAHYATNGLMRHFKAGVNAAWRDGYDLERDEARYEAKHGAEAGNAFTDGFVFSASYL